MLRINIILLVCCCFLFIISCQKLEIYSVIPNVQFKRYSLSDSVDALDNKVKKGILEITVVDGDGDIGLRETDTTGAHSQDSINFNNLFIDLYQKKNSQYQLVGLSVAHNYRTPYLEPSGQNKAIKATIKVELEYNPLLYNFDTIKYNFYIVDRALNKSNIASSPDIPFKKNMIIE